MLPVFGGLYPLLLSCQLQGERNYIMQVICEATQNSSVSVQVGAFEVLVKIMTHYYDKMGFYMERALFGVRPDFRTFTHVCSICHRS